MTPFADLAAEQILSAIRLFLQMAYADGRVPETHQHWLGLSTAIELSALQQRPGVDWRPGPPPTLSIRLGNGWYPHMKLRLDQVEDEASVFSVDTHDALECPMTSPDFDQMRRMQSRNLELARTIEVAWDAAGLPTQAGLLRQFLDEASS